MIFRQQIMKPIRSITSATKKQSLNVKEIVLFHVKIHILSIFFEKDAIVTPKVIPLHLINHRIDNAEL